MKKNKKPLVVLCYHGLCHEPTHHLNDFCFMTAERFKQNLEDIKKSGWSFIELNEGLNRLREGSLASPSVALTFDDGFAETLRLAEPILKAESTCATVFIPTELSRQGCSPWFTDVIHIIRSTIQKHIEFFGHRLPLSTPAERAAANRIIQASLKLLHPLAIHAVLEDLSDALQVKSASEDFDYRVANEAECADARSHGIFAFGAHSATHAIHSKLTTHELEQEIAESVEHIRRMTDTDLCLYAYPNGRPSDFSMNCKTLLKRYGVTAAFTTIEGWNSNLNDPYALRRFCVGQSTDVTAILRSSFWKASTLIS